MPSLTSYAPSIFAFLLASIFIEFPFLAVIVVAGSLITFGILYASIITRLWKIQRDSRNSFGAAPEFKNVPGFKNVTVQMFEKSGTWFKSPN
jgi:hypothetical protein